MACPLQKKYGDIICIDGMLWGLTYSEMAPPDSRQALGPCDYCKGRGLQSHPDAAEQEDCGWCDGTGVELR